MIMNTSNPYRSSLVLASLLGSMALSGCSMPNSSNPTLSVSQASVNNNSATLDIQIQNPSDMDVQIDTVDWSLIFGPLPVADGVWELGVPLASKDSYTFTRMIQFTSPALDPSASTIELSGSLRITTDGDTGEMSLKDAGFVSKSEVQH